MDNNKTTTSQEHSIPKFLLMALKTKHKEGSKAYCKHYNKLLKIYKNQKPTTKESLKLLSLKRINKNFDRNISKKRAKAHKVTVLVFW